MKIVSVKSQALAYFFVTLLICFSLHGQAFAGWSCAQGCSGQIYDTSKHDTAVEPILFYGWGMGYQQKHDATNWLVFPVPSIGLASVRYLALNLKAELGGDIYVDRVAVWSGDTKLIPDIVVNWSGSIGWKLVDLGAAHQVTSLSVSLRTQTGEFGGKLDVYSVCAEFL
jgi:hypothetical protein